MRVSTDCENSREEGFLPQGHPPVVILSLDLYEHNKKWKVGGMDWASTYLYTCIERSNMYSTEQCVDLIIVLFVLLYKQKTNGLKN